MASTSGLLLEGTNFIIASPTRLAFLLPAPEDAEEMALESDTIEFLAARNEKPAEVVGEAGVFEKRDDIGEASEAKLPVVGETADEEEMEDEDEVRECRGFEACSVSGRLGSSFGVVEVRIMSLLEQFMLWLSAGRAERRRWGI